MRSIPAALKQRFESQQQTRANNADPAAHVTISRPTVPLTSEDYLERTVVDALPSLTACDVAVRRRSAKKEPDRAYAAYVSNGAAGVKSAALTADLTEMVWEAEPFAESASDVAICFDGRMVRQADGTTTLLTDERPWTFWVDGSGKCKGRILGLLGDVTLAESNCTAVTAVRATQSAVSAYDFGLIVFMVLNGALFYRQLIAGTWYDAEFVSFGPPGASWADVAASRTADWRVVLQAKTSLGNVYELFTQFMGIGSKSGSEHVAGLANATESHSLTGIAYHEAKAPGEHVTLADATPPPYNFAYELGPVAFLGAWNENDGAGDYGRRVVCKFDKELNPADVQANEGSFTLVDSLGSEFYPIGIEMDATGRFMTLVYVSINNAVGDLTVSYTPGTIKTMAGETLGAFSQTFTPVGLVPVAGLPTVESITNDGDQYIIVEFSEALTGTLDATRWHVLTPKTTALGWVQTELTKLSVEWYGGTDKLKITLPSGNQDSLQGCGGTVTIRYTGATLAGENGPLLGFSQSFTVTGVDYRGDQFLPEAVELSDASQTVTLTRIYYSDAQAPAEAVAGLADATLTWSLTKVEDI